MKSPKEIAEHCLGWHKTTEAVLEDIEKAIQEERNAHEDLINALVLVSEQMSGFNHFEATCEKMVFEALAKSGVNPSLNGGAK